MTWQERVRAAIAADLAAAGMTECQPISLVPKKTRPLPLLRKLPRRKQFKAVWDSKATITMPTVRIEG